MPNKDVVSLNPDFLLTFQFVEAEVGYEVLIKRSELQESRSIGQDRTNFSQTTLYTLNI